MILPLLALCQAKIDSVSKRVYLKEVHKINGDPNDLKIKVHEWIVKNHENSSDVTILLDEDTKIIAKESEKFYAVVESPLGSGIKLNVEHEYILDLEFRKNRYRIEIEQIGFKVEGVQVRSYFETYLMSFEEFKEFYVLLAENYKGMGSKAMLRRVNDDKELRKIYDGQQKFGTQIISKISGFMNGLDASLLSYLKKPSVGEDEGS